MKLKTAILWILQLTCAAILFRTSWGKLSSQPAEVFLFTKLGMEPTGRYIIGVVEGCAALLLLTGRLSAVGGLLALGTMLGALIAHVTILGFDFKHAVLWSTVLTSSTIITIGRRRHLPLIGGSFGDSVP
jgi:uncharacterized membrane protein YphA (DoxX/SURF4 family)